MRNLSEVISGALMSLVYECVKALSPFKLFSWSQNTDYVLQFMVDSGFHYLWAGQIPNSEEGDRIRYTSILLHLEPEKDD